MNLASPRMISWEFIDVNSNQLLRIILGQASNQRRPTEVVFTAGKPKPRFEEIRLAPRRERALLRQRTRKSLGTYYNLHLLGLAWCTALRRDELHPDTQLPSIDEKASRSSNKLDELGVVAGRRNYPIHGVYMGLLKQVFQAINDLSVYN